MMRKERVALQRATIIALRKKDPTITTSQLAARLGIAVNTVTRIVHEETTGMRRKHDGTRVPLKRDAPPASEP